MERFIRTHGWRAQRIYDAMPPVFQSMITSARGAMLPRNVHRREVISLVRQLQSREHWTASETEQAQVAALRDTIAHSRASCAQYADYAPLGDDGLQGLARYPILDREAVRQKATWLISSTTPRHERIRVGTTGTTGAALSVFYDTRLMWIAWAYLLRHWTWAGIPLDAPRITFYGNRMVASDRHQPPYWAYNRVERQTLASAFHLSVRTADDYVRFLEARRGQVLEGFPTVLGIMAEFVLERGLQIPMRAVFTSGEPVYPSIRKSVETAFGCKLYDTYGMTELCGLIQECAYGRMHLIPDYGFLEIVDEQNQPARAHEEGAFVWTGFLNRCMPLIRYRIGDRGRWDTEQACPCGRTFPLVRATITRDSDLFRSPDGRVFSPRTLNQTLKATTAFRFCQFVHNAPASLTIRAVPAGDAATEEIERVCRTMRGLLGSSITVSWTFADAPIMRAGKVPLIYKSFR